MLNTSCRVWAYCALRPVCVPMRVLVCACVLCVRFSCRCRNAFKDHKKAFKLGSDSSRTLLRRLRVQACFDVGMRVYARGTFPARSHVRCEC